MFRKAEETIEGLQEQVGYLEDKVANLEDALERLAALVPGFEYEQD